VTLFKKIRDVPPLEVFRANPTLWRIAATEDANTTDHEAHHCQGGPSVLENVAAGRLDSVPAGAVPHDG